MKLSSLILTDTKEMNREEWLAFRRPSTHVTRFLQDYYKTQVDSKGMKEGYLFRPESYEFLKYVFKTDLWQGYIFPTVGASEIASVVGLSPYKSVIELFYEKVGIKETFDEDNAAMYWGRTLEATIAENWQYWGGDFESLLLNQKLGKVVRKCRRINAYVQNKDFPWIFVSLDRVINKHGDKEEGSLECKTISGYAANMWEHGIPPMYVAQNQTQCFVCLFDYGEIAILKDGRHFEVYPFQLNQDVADRLKTESQHFFEIVKAGIEHLFLCNAANDEATKKEHLAAIDQLSPEPDGSTAYESYLKEAYQEGGFELVGGLEQLHLARAYKFYDTRIKDLEENQRECSNKLKAYMKDAAVLDFGPDGKCTWKANAKGVRSFRVNVEPGEDFKPDATIIKSEERVPF